MSSPALSTAAPAPGREYGLDWLRAFAFCVLIFYHSGMAFVSWDWHLKNPQQSTTLEHFMLLVNRWRLPLLFLISGAGVYFSLRRRSLGAFAVERVRRLLVPLVFAMFVIVPPQIYFERLYQGAHFSYAEFYPSVFKFVAYPKGSFSWHHLWFVAYILVFSLIGIPLFAAIRSERGQRLVSAMVRTFEKWPVLVYLINVPNILAGVLLGPHWPATHNLTADWANFTGTFLTFLWGFVIASNRGFLDLITRRRKEYAIAGIVTAAVFFGIRGSGVAASWTPDIRLWLSNIVSGLFGMTWIFAMIGYARHLVRHSSPLLKYATECVYPFYIFHQTVTVAIVYYIIGLQWPILPKLVVVALGTFLGSWALTEMARRSGPLRPLFGLKAERS
jgi:glucans biosynthesis protein C